jgi:hypothetical protein
MRRKREQSQIPKEVGMSQSDRLSIHRSFVLRLYPSADLDAAISGRVEHVVSGETKEFRSLSDLLHSLRQLLPEP